MSNSQQSTLLLLTAKRLAHNILQALHFQAEHRRTNFAQHSRRQLLQQSALEAFQQAYLTSTELKLLIPKHGPKNQIIRKAAALRSALRQYQGAYWAWKEEKNEANALELEIARSRMRQAALNLKKMGNEKNRKSFA